jgi:hypothetical protein
VHVISISKQAREQCLSESAIRAALEERGNRIMTSDDFLRLLDELKDKVLKGTATLAFVETRFRIKPVAFKRIQHQPKADCR